MSTQQESLASHNRKQRGPTHTAASSNPGAVVVTATAAAAAAAGSGANTPAHSSPKEALQHPPQYHTIFQANCPLRCAVLLFADSPAARSGEISTAQQLSPSRVPKHSPVLLETCVAVGSNAKCMHAVSFRMQDDFLQQRSHFVTSSVTVKHTYENVHKGSVYAMDWLPAQGVSGTGMLVSASNDKVLRITRYDEDTSSDTLAIILLCSCRVHNPC